MCGVCNAGLSAVGAAKVVAWGAGDATTFLGSATLLLLLFPSSSSSSFFLLLAPLSGFLPSTVFCSTFSFSVAMYVLFSPSSLPSALVSELVSVMHICLFASNKNWLRMEEMTNRAPGTLRQGSTGQYRPLSLFSS